MLGRLMILAALSLIACGGPSDEPNGIGQEPSLTEQDWTTPAEQDEFRSSPSFEETMSWLDRLDAVSPAMDIQTFGQTAQGREMKLVVVSPDGAFTPEAAHKSGKPVVLVLNGIHSAEICGKDASLILLRELLVEGKHPGLLEAMTLLVVPVYNIDGHERPDHRFSRINQDGPEKGMGFRTTATGMDLNRDFMKLETVEAQNLVSEVMVRWDPQLMIDVHTTDGMRHRHQLAYGYDDGPAVHPAIGDWMRNTVAGAAQGMDEAGRPVAMYAGFVDRSDPSKGMSGGWSRPMLSTSYSALRDRPSILSEAYSYLPYGTRVEATHEFMVQLLEEVAANPSLLIDAVARADADLLEARGQPLPVRVTNTDEQRPIKFLGYRSYFEPSEISGAPIIRWTDEPVDFDISLYDRLKPTLEVTIPAGYLIPPQFAEVADKLRLHGFTMHRFGTAQTLSVEMVRLLKVKFSDQPFQGRQTAELLGWDVEKQQREFPAGTWWLPLNQPSAKVAVHLLEPMAPDSLFAWGYLSRATEGKEWFSDFVLEPMAKKMMAEDPALKAEFEKKLAEDEDFRNDSYERLHFFYRRTDFADPDWRLHPIARVVDPLPANIAFDPGN